MFVALDVGVPTKSRITFVVDAVVTVNEVDMVGELLNTAVVPVPVTAYFMFFSFRHAF